ncbi:hypothetical protein J4410_03510 [Candidatus Woesearchaeota archaeon]|nr:hypothetical protein [Candidatus Woesearchaeota archaeon]
MNPRALLLQHLARAEQLLRVVYPLSQNPKVLLDACKEIQKGIPFLLQLNLEMSVQQEAMINEIQKIIEKHEQAPVEFSKDKRFVICSPEYDLTQLSSQNITHYLTELRSLISHE